MGDTREGAHVHGGSAGIEREHACDCVLFEMRRIFWCTVVG